MTAADLLTSCRERGIVLIDEGENLRFRAPRGAMTPDLKAALARHKRELLAMLRESIDQEMSLGTGPEVSAETEDKRPVWVLYPDGFPEKVFTVDRIPPEATHWCREGDKSWQSLGRDIHGERKAGTRQRSR
jgi:hypothetical protein